MKTSISVKLKMPKMGLKAFKPSKVSTVKVNKTIKPVTVKAMKKTNPLKNFALKKLK